MLSLPLAKLSVAVDAEPHEQRFTWQHETHDLAFVLDSHASHGPAQLLKVVQGTQVRQLIDLECLISQGDAIITSMQHRGVQLKAEELPVSALVRCPLLAIRWQLPNKKIRRAQLRFTSTQDYKTAYNHLHQLGLRISSSGESQGRSSSRMPSPERASTPSPASILATQPPRSVAGGLSCPPSRLAEVGNRPYTATNAPTSLESQLQEAAHLRQVSADPGYRLGIREDPRSFPELLTPPVYFARPTSATSDILDRTGGAEVRLDSALSDQRPVTADNVLPPRRELPFHHSYTLPSLGRDSARYASRPSTSTMGPPPLPSRVVYLRPHPNRAAAGQEMQTSQLPRPTATASYATEAPQTPTQVQYVVSPTDHASPHKSINTQQESSSSTASSPLSSFKQGTFAALPPSRPSVNVTQGSRQTMSQNTPTSPPMSEHHNHGPTTCGGASLLSSSQVDSLSGYAMQSEEARRVALNEFIFRHLENDEFLTLVEDMESRWTTITLGMR